MNLSSIIREDVRKVENKIIVKEGSNMYKRETELPGSLTSEPIPRIPIT